MNVWINFLWNISLKALCNKICNIPSIIYKKMKNGAQLLKKEKVNGCPNDISLWNIFLKTFYGKRKNNWLFW